MITKKINILMVEDSITDASLIQRQINKCVEDADIRLVDDLLKFRHALKTFVPDFVISDYQLVGFNALDVINDLNIIYPKTPVIIITGTLNNEELAADSILNGAAAFLLKNDINNLYKKLEPIFDHLIDKNDKELKRLEKKRIEREKLEEIHATLKNAAKLDLTDENVSTYYEKLIGNISENIKSLLS